MADVQKSVSSDTTHTGSNFSMYTYASRRKVPTLFTKCFPTLSPGDAVSSCTNTRTETAISRQVMDLQCCGHTCAPPVTSPMKATHTTELLQG